MSNIKAWIISLRLRTLPLALSTIFMGSFLSFESGSFRLPVLIWAALTTLFLQILSNLANDYGDTLSGADNDERQGPRRMIQQGKISLKQMKQAIIITSALALISGLILIYISLKGAHLYAFVFFIMGIAAITAAIKYTVGNNPYGYRGMGDLYVFLFFGLMGVGGTYFLHTGEWDWPVLFPSIAIGFFSTGVLNLNNTRDIETDKKSGKRTLPVIMGRDKASLYHLFLIISGWAAMILWLIKSENGTNGWLTFFSLPVYIKSILAVFQFKNQPERLDPELRNLSLGTLFFVILYGISIYLN